MLQINVVNAAVVTSYLREVATRAPKALHKALAKSAAVVERNAKKQVSGPRLRVDKGGLRSSIVSEIDREALIATVGPTVVYGRIHEYGGHIAPKKGRFLAVPLSELQRRTPAGKGKATGRVFPTATHLLMEGLDLEGSHYLEATEAESREKVRAFFDEAVGGVIERR